MPSPHARGKLAEPTGGQRQALSGNSVVFNMIANREEPTESGEKQRRRDRSEIWPRSGGCGRPRSQLRNSHRSRTRTARQQGGEHKSPCGMETTLAVGKHDHFRKASVRRPKKRRPLLRDIGSPAPGRHSCEWRLQHDSRVPSSMSTMTQPPPPAPQTLAARAPCFLAAAISLSMSGVVMPGALVRRSFHSSFSRRSTSAQLRALQRDMHFAGNAGNFGEVADDVLVAIDVLLEDLPVVDARLARRTGINQHEALVHFFGGRWRSARSECRRDRDGWRSRRRTSRGSSPGSRWARESTAPRHSGR